VRYETCEHELNQFEACQVVQSSLKNIHQAYDRVFGQLLTTSLDDHKLFFFGKQDRIL
jgi:hypothetical protein